MPDTPYSHAGRVRSAFERTNRIDRGKRCVEMPDTPYSHAGRVRSAFERTNRIDRGKRCVEMRDAPYRLVQPEKSPGRELLPGPKWANSNST